MKLILACDSTGGIGYKNKLPWKHISGDLQRFKETTTNQTVLMGRNTWESLPIKPLPNRKNIVVSSTLTDYPNDVTVISDLNQLQDDDVWLIGGAKLVKSCWNSVTEIHLTKTFTKYHCDTYIDLLKLDDFALVFEKIYPDHFYQIYKR